MLLFILLNLIIAVFTAVMKCSLFDACRLIQMIFFFKLSNPILSKSNEPSLQVIQVSKYKFLFVFTTGQQCHPFTARFKFSRRVRGLNFSGLRCITQRYECKSPDNQQTANHNPRSTQVIQTAAMRERWATGEGEYRRQPIFSWQYCWCCVYEGA